MIKNIEGLEAEFETLMEIQAQLKIIKAEEIKLRRALAETLLDSADIGTHTTTSGAFICKATKKVSYSLDRELLDEIWNDLSLVEREAIDLKPSLKMKEYKTLESGLLDEAITVKPAMPSIEISYIGE